MVNVSHRRVESAGWGNVYLHNGRLRFANRVYPTKQIAMDLRPQEPISEYLDTVEIFLDPHDAEKLKTKETNPWKLSF